MKTTVKTAQETKKDVLAALDEHNEAIREFLEGLGFKRVHIRCHLAISTDSNEDPPSSSRHNELYIGAHYD